MLEGPTREERFVSKPPGQYLVGNPKVNCDVKPAARKRVGLLVFVDRFGIALQKKQSDSRLVVGIRIVRISLGGVPIEAQGIVVLALGGKLIAFTCQQRRRRQSWTAALEQESRFAFEGGTLRQFRHATVALRHHP